MDKKVDLAELLAGTDNESVHMLDLFALSNLGLIEALVNGLLDAEDATRFFYNADNCLYVKNRSRTRRRMR